MSVPAGSIRRTWLPIRTPDNIDENQKILHASVLNFVGSGDAALLSRTKGENRMIGESLLALDPTELKTGMITNLPLHGEPVEMSTGPDEVYETVVAVRQSYDGNRTISNLHDRFMAPHAAAYDALDQLVLSNDRIAADSGGISAIRNWIARGGYAWIMLDLVDLETVESLLGNATPYEVVDRVELTEFTIRGPGKESSSTGITETWTAEEPVEFLRVVIDSAEVHSSIDGWPASFSIPFGNGKVFFTTLAARGWRYQPNQFSDPLDGDQPMEGPTRALKNFAGQFNQRVESKTEFGDGVKPILLEQLGYRIPSRSVAALLLGLSCAVIAISGFWLRVEGATGSFRLGHSRQHHHSGHGTDRDWRQQHVADPGDLVSHPAGQCWRRNQRDSYRHDCGFLQPRYRRTSAECWTVGGGDSRPARLDRCRQTSRLG